MGNHSIAQHNVSMGSNIRIPIQMSSRSPHHIPSGKSNLGRVSSAQQENVQQEPSVSIVSRKDADSIQQSIRRATSAMGSENIHRLPSGYDSVKLVQNEARQR